VVGGHFEDPRVTNVIRCCRCAVVGGFQNIGVVTFRRELRFGREFQFGIVKKSATFVVTLVAAFMLRILGARDRAGRRAYRRSWRAM
jgi:hypothetical protein